MLKKISGFNPKHGSSEMRRELRGIYITAEKQCSGLVLSGQFVIVQF